MGRQNIYVLHDETKAPFENVEVQVKGKQATGTYYTDSNGKINFKTCHPCFYKVIVVPPDDLYCVQSNCTLVFWYSPDNKTRYHNLLPAPPKLNISLPSIPSLSARVEFLTRVLTPISFNALPILSAHVALPAVVTIPPLSFAPLPSLTPSVKRYVLLNDPLANAITAENQATLAEAFASRTVGFDIPGWTKPPFICFVCGERLNSEEDFIIHMTEHLTAYEEGG